MSRELRTAASCSPRMALTDARAIASGFIAMLEGSYERLEIAGSVRRRAATVGDIEVVAVPLRAIQYDLFGARTDTAVDLLDRTLNDARNRGEVAGREGAAGRQLWGPRAKYLTFEGASIDLFAPEAERFGWILALRTGPAAFSRQLVRPSDRRTKDGRPGLLPRHLAPRDGWLTSRVSGEKIPTPDEADVFRLFGMPHLEDRKSVV